MVIIAQQRKSPIRHVRDWILRPSTGTCLGLQKPAGSTKKIQSVNDR